MMNDTRTKIQRIGDVVHLKKAGNSWKGLCPFHQEKTPSFSVSEDGDMTHCFGCSWSGDFDHFIAAIEGKMPGIEYDDDGAKL